MPTSNFSSMLFFGSITLEFFIIKSGPFSFGSVLTFLSINGSPVDLFMEYDDRAPPLESSISPTE